MIILLPPGRWHLDALIENLSRALIHNLRLVNITTIRCEAWHDMALSMKAELTTRPVIRDQRLRLHHVHGGLWLAECGHSQLDIVI